MFEKEKKSMAAVLGPNGMEDGGVKKKALEGCPRRRSEQSKQASKQLESQKKKKQFFVSFVLTNLGGGSVECHVQHFALLRRCRA